MSISYMKNFHKRLFVLFFSTTFLFCSFAQAREMKYSLSNTSLSFQTNDLTSWPWDPKPEPKPKPDPTAFNMVDILELETKLNEAILGQTFATNELSNNLISYQAGMNDPNRPIGVFLFIGPTGVGKTQLAKELSKALLGSELQLIRFDMSEYSEPHTISKLIGSPPGYLGSEKGGILTEAIRSRTNSIILLDEVEKAAPEVLKLFLSAFDEGRITSSMGETFNLNSTIFILTTNLASEEILQFSNEDLDGPSILETIEGKIISQLTPELYNRTSPIIFKAIPLDLYPKIIDRELAFLSKRLLSVKKIHLTFDPSVNEYLFNAIHSNRLGVRPVKRLIDKVLVGNLARFIVSEKPAPGTTLLMAIDGDQIVITDTPETGSKRPLERSNKLSS